TLVGDEGSMQTRAPRPRASALKALTAPADAGGNRLGCTIRPEKKSQNRAPIRKHSPSTREQRKMKNVKLSRTSLWLIAWALLLPGLSALADEQTPERRYFGLGHGVPSTHPPDLPPPDGLPGGPGAADPFQRYIIFHNQLPITTYPVITARESENCGPQKRSR